MTDEAQPPHPTSVAVWGVPSPVAAASRFTATVGVKCSAGCPLAGRPVVIRDETGRELGRGALGAEPAAGTRALYAAAINLTAPPEPGVHAWTAAFPGGTAPLPALTPATRPEPAPAKAAGPRHDPASAFRPEAPPAPRHEPAAAAFSFRTVEPPEHAVTVTVTVVDRDTEAALGNADVHLGRHRASTDSEGKARIEVPEGDYELYVRSPGYAPSTEPVTVTGDAALRVDAARVSDADLDDDQVWM